MIQQTSIECYHKIKAEGLLSKLRFQVYEILFQYGPLTQGECCRKLQSLIKCQQHDITPRFAELKARQVIYEIRSRPCSVTERNCIEWGLTGNLPIKPMKRETLKQKISRLEAEIVDLKAKLASNSSFSQGWLFRDRK